MKKQLLLLATAPLMGAAFVAFLPVIGFALRGYALCLKAAEGLVSLDKRVNEA